jgi:hypothetical protein
MLQYVVHFSPQICCWYNGASGCSEPKRTGEGNALIIIFVVIIINVILFFLFFLDTWIKRGREKSMYKS